MKQLYVIAAVTMAGVSAVFTLFAELEKRYGLSTTSLGWIAGSAFLAALVAQLWLARYADRGHATLLLRAGVLAGAAGLLWFAAATEVWQFVAARALLGAGVGMVVPPARRAIVVTADGDAGERLGTFYSAYLAGFVLGPPFAGTLAQLGDVRLPFAVLGGITLLTLVGVLRRPLPTGTERAAPADANRDQRRVLRRLIRDRRMIAALLVVVSFRYSIGVFEPLWAVHLDDLGASTTVVTLSLTAFALPMLIVARPAGRLSDRYGSRWASLIASLITVPIMASYGYIGILWLVLAIAIPHGLMEAVLSPGSQSAVAEASGQDDAASAQGLAEAGGSGAAAVGAFTAPALFDAWGPGPAWVVAGVVMGVLLGVSWLLDAPRPRATARSATARSAELLDEHDDAIVG